VALKSFVITSLNRIRTGHPSWRGMFCIIKPDTNGK